LLQSLSKRTECDLHGKACELNDLFSRTHMEPTYTVSLHHVYK